MWWQIPCLCRKITTQTCKMTMEWSLDKLSWCNHVNAKSAFCFLWTLDREYWYFHLKKKSGTSIHSVLSAFHKSTNGNKTLIYIKISSLSTNEKPWSSSCLIDRPICIMAQRNLNRKRNMYKTGSADLLSVLHSDW